MRRAVQEPLRQIVINAGGEASVVVNNVIAQSGAYGYNARSGEYGDLIEMGVIDPTKVVRTALENAASIAGMMLTTEALIIDKPKHASTQGAADMGGMGGMGGMGM